MDFTSEPAEGAVVYDWRNETLTVSMVNGDQEKFYFEVEPNAKPLAMSHASGPAWAKVKLDLWLMRPKYGQLTF